MPVRSSTPAPSGAHALAAAAILLAAATVSPMPALAQHGAEPGSAGGGPGAVAGPPVAADTAVPPGGQSPRVILRRVDARLGFLVTGGETFSDRPVGQVDAGLQFGRARFGGPPVLGVTAGVAVGVGDILAEGASASLRVLGGVEAPWAFTRGGRAGALELVPALQVGLQHAFGEDERDGFTMRAAVGIRIPLARDGSYLTFEPFSFALLAPPGTHPEVDRRGVPVDLAETSRPAFEVGILKFGWRF